MKYGQIVEAVITDINGEKYFAQVDGQTFEVVQTADAIDYVLDEEVEGVAYEDRFGNALIQTDLPDIRPGIYGWGQVQLVRRDLGVFVDIGLIDKDIVVSLDDLPFERHHWPQKDDYLMITYEVDDRNRFWGQLATPEEVGRQAVKAPRQAMNKDTTATVYRLREEGALAITEEGYLGFLHHSERFDDSRLGETFTTRIINVRQDGGVNLSVKPRAHEAISDDAQMLLAMLERHPHNHLPLHDRSSPDEIRQQLGISKGQFKRAIGNLLRQKLITQKIGKGIYLVKGD